MVAKKKKTAAKAKSKRTSSTLKKSTAGKSLVDMYETVNVPTLELEEYAPQMIEDDSVEDLIGGSTHYAWLGAGQCGGRLVKSFYELGYRKALALNTTHHDLDLLELPKSQKFLMDIGEMGAGKDMSRGQEATQRYQQEIIHLKQKIFGSKINHIMVCFGAGGGTGSGSAVKLVEIAKKYARHAGIENPNKRVGVMLTLPTVGEASSPLVSQNTYRVVSELGQLAQEGKISPLIIIDNEKISKMYPGLTVKNFWSTINNTVAGLFDIFNRLSALSTDYTSFDTVDYHSIMEAGGCAIMGLTKVTEFKDKYAISTAVKHNLQKTLLANGFDLSSAKVAGCIMVGGRKLMANVPGLQDNINYAFDVLSDITGKATIHRGIYEDNKDSLRVYTVIGGLDLPTKRLAEFTD
jgi:cell division GTPase FtsZ